MTEQRLSAQNPRELTANELDQVAGGASDNAFWTGMTRSGGMGSFFPTGKVTGSTVAASSNGGVENPGTVKELGTTNVHNHFVLVPPSGH
jgi:hypothetical protein